MKTNSVFQQFRFIYLVVTLLLFCWLTMQAVHELGHVIGACYCRVTINQIVLGPLTISQTLLGEATHLQRLVITWLGPIVGMLLPFGIWLAAMRVGLPEAFLCRFFAGFCCAANGCYLLFGPSDGFTDTGVLLTCGAMRWQLMIIGLAGIISGFILWNKQSPYFGIGKIANPVTIRTLTVMTLFLFVIIIAEMMFFPWSP